MESKEDSLITHDLHGEYYLLANYNAFSSGNWAISNFLDDLCLSMILDQLLDYVWKIVNIFNNLDLGFNLKFQRALFDVGNN